MVCNGFSSFEVIWSFKVWQNYSLCFKISDLHLLREISHKNLSVMVFMERKTLEGQCDICCTSVRSRDELAGAAFLLL